MVTKMLKHSMWNIPRYVKNLKEVDTNFIFWCVEDKNRTFVASCEPDNVGHRDSILVHHLAKVEVEPKNATCGISKTKFCSWVSLKIKNIITTIWTSLTVACIKGLINS